MGRNGFRVDLAALDQAAQGVQASCDALGASLGADITAGYAGDTAADHLHLLLDLASSDLGHADLASAWNHFLDRRGWDVRTRLKEGGEMAGRLKDSRAWYQKAEDGAVGALKEVLEDVAGNPNTTNAGQKSWSQIEQDIRPDWTKASFYNGQQVAQAGSAISGDVGSMGQDVQGALHDPQGLGAVAVPGYAQVQQELHSEQGR